MAAADKDIDTARIIFYLVDKDFDTVNFNLTVWSDENSILRYSRTFLFKQVEPVFGRGLEPIKKSLQGAFSVCLFATNQIVGQ